MEELNDAREYIGIQKLLMKTFQVDFGIFNVFTYEAASGWIQGRNFSVSEQNIFTYIKEERTMIAGEFDRRRVHKQS